MSEWERQRERKGESEVRSTLRYLRERGSDIQKERKRDCEKVRTGG